MVVSFLVVEVQCNEYNSVLALVTALFMVGTVLVYPMRGQYIVIMQSRHVFYLSPNSLMPAKHPSLKPPQEHELTIPEPPPTNLSQDKGRKTIKRTIPHWPIRP